MVSVAVDDKADDERNVSINKTTLVELLYLSLLLLQISIRFIFSLFIYYYYYYYYYLFIHSFIHSFIHHEGVRPEQSPTPTQKCAL